MGVLAGVYSVIAFECGFDRECFSLALDNMKKTYELRYRGILKDGNP